MFNVISESSATTIFETYASRIRCTDEISTLYTESYRMLDSKESLCSSIAYIWASLFSIFFNC